MLSLSRLLEPFRGRDRTVSKVIFVVTVDDKVWGVFSSIELAKASLRTWAQSFSNAANIPETYIGTYFLDYRKYS